MSGDFRELKGLRVFVEKVVYVPHLEAPPERPHSFVYFIEIRNDSKQVVSIRGRKWILEDEEGGKIVVEGQGVVGETPELRPGERFSYNSYHVVAGNSTASGAYFGVNAAGEGIFVKIPEFRLTLPIQG